MKIGETLARRCIKMGLLSALGFVSVSCSGESDAPREVTVAASDGLQDYDLTCTAGDSVSFSSVAEGDTLSVNVSNDLVGFHLASDKGPFQIALNDAAKVSQ